MKVTYAQSRLDSEPANVKDEIDPAFYNDNYWLSYRCMFTGTPTPMSNRGVQQYRWGRDSAKQVVVKYPSEAASPGDT